MGKYKRYKNSLEKFLSGDSGKRFFNFAYSLGAAVVILGALFKILHLPGGNAMLCIGMGTEVLTIRPKNIIGKKFFLYLTVRIRTIVRPLPEVMVRLL